MGSATRLVMDAHNRFSRNGVNMMADEKSFLENSSTQDMAVHVHDYYTFYEDDLLRAAIALLHRRLYRSPDPQIVDEDRGSEGSERRDALCRDPQTVKKFAALGATMAVEKGAGEGASTSLPRFRGGRERPSAAAPTSLKGASASSSASTGPIQRPSGVPKPARFSSAASIRSASASGSTAMPVPGP